MPQYLTFSEQNLFIFVYFCAVPFKKNRKKTAKKTAKKPLKGLLSQEKFQKNCKALQHLSFRHELMSTIPHVGVT